MPQKTAQELANEFAQFQKHVTEALAQGDGRMSRIEQDMRNNSETLSAIKSDTADVKDLLETWRAGRFAFIGVGKFALWLVSVVASIAMVVQIWRGKLF